MKITVQEIPRMDFQAANDDRHADFDDMRIGMRNRNMLGKNRETHCPQRRQISYRAVGHDADATKCPVDGRVDVTQDRSRGSIRWFTLNDQ